MMPPSITPISIYFGVAPTSWPVLRFCARQPADAMATQIAAPVVIAAIIPGMLTTPAAFSINVLTSSAAMLMPDTGRLVTPTMPAIRADTAAKKKPKTMIAAAPTQVTFTAGTRMAQRNTPMTPKKMEMA